MGKTKETGFGGFDAIFESLGHERTETVPNLTPDAVGKEADDDSGEAVDLSLGKKKTVRSQESSFMNPDDLEKTSSDDDDDFFQEEDDDHTEEVEVKTKPKKEKQEETKNQEDADDISENETSNVVGFFDAFAETLGWDVEDDEKPKSVEDLVEYVRNVVDENSKPQYAAKEVEDLNEFVKNGGNIEDYFQSLNQINDYKNIDITDESNQKRVVRDYLAYTGLNESQINRKLSKYEEAGLLEDEAEEALEHLQTVKEAEQKQLLANQQKEADEFKETQRKFYTSVVTEIENLKDIRGINVPKEDLKNLKDYLFKVEGDGKTRYQKDYSKSVKNLIESAYFTMKGDALIKSAQKSGETSAVKKLKNTLTTTKISSSKHGMNDGETAPVWSISSFLRKPTN